MLYGRRDAQGVFPVPTRLSKRQTYLKGACNCPSSLPMRVEKLGKPDVEAPDPHTGRGLAVNMSITAPLRPSLSDAAPSTVVGQGWSPTGVFARSMVKFLQF